MSATTSTFQSYKQQLQSFSKNLQADESLTALRLLCRTDLWFLIRHVLNRPDIDHPWLWERCREVQDNPNGYLDLWAREHYKSTIITFGKTIQDILASHGSNPLPEWKGKEPTFAIFSCTRPIAKGFFRQIKREFETNEKLKHWFPDILWADPVKEAPKWSEDDGLILKRKSNPKESSLEAWGLIDGQPTSRHFTGMVFDDVVTLDHVRTSDMIRKVTEAWSMSLNLGAENGFARYCGTRYHLHDPYQEIMKREAAIPRLHPGTADGTGKGEPVLWTRETLDRKRREMGGFIFSCQILQDPQADSGSVFKPQWFQRSSHEVKWDGMSRAIIVDPSGSSKQRWSDFSSFWVVGYGEDENWWVLDGVKDKLNLKERGDVLFDLHRKWKPLGTFYEQYGMQSDVEHLRERMDQESYRFFITEIGGTKLSKEDRIKKLIPLFEAGRIIFPTVIANTDYQGRHYNLVDEFFETEFTSFPYCVHDDGLDALSRITDEVVREKIKKPHSRPGRRERARMLEAMPRPMIV